MDPSPTLLHIAKAGQQMTPLDTPDSLDAGELLRRPQLDISPVVSQCRPSPTPPPVPGGAKDATSRKPSIRLVLTDEHHSLSQTNLMILLTDSNNSLPSQDYEAESSDCKYATDIRPHAYPKEAMSPRSEYDRQQPYLPLSSCSWESSSSLEAMPGNPDASGHVMAKSGTKSDIFAPRRDYLMSRPTTGPHMRRSYPEAAKVDCSFDCHTEHHYKGSDRFTAFTNCNGQSIECRSEWNYSAEIPSLSSRRSYHDEIPSLSSHKSNGISYPRQWQQYGTDIPRSQVDRVMVNTSGQFVGLAEMLGPVDFKKTMDFWQQNKWNGFFPVVWHIVKDIPNRLFKHITLENNDNRPAIFSRDTQEIGLPQGLEVLKIFKAYRHGTSILDDFDFYEEKENTRCARKGINADSLHEARLSYFGTDDLKSMGDIEASMESLNLHEPWD
ncbi:hypothetical protein ZWY2020_009549 [Hordeum vulgare]|nr:hypothetical protein ZWY2020_009549 [Hordeum vulgare]